MLFIFFFFLFTDHGIENKPIEMSAVAVTVKADEDYINEHPFELEAIKDLPKHLANPLAILNGKLGRKLVFISLQHKGHNFILTISLYRKKPNRQGENVVNSILSIFPKDNYTGLYYSFQKDLLWAEQTEMLRYIQDHEANLHAVGINAKHFANLIQNFENSKYLDGIDDVNTQFNRELEQLIKGDLSKGHVFKLGMPDKKYLKNGINNLPIELSAKTLLNKANKNYKRQHPYYLKDVKNLPLALKHPIALFKGEQGRVVALLELQNHGNNFVAILGLFQHPKERRKGKVINSIISIFPKDDQIELDKLLKLPKLWDDKTKMNRFIQVHNSCYAEGINPIHSDTNINNNGNKSNINPLEGFGLTKLGTGEKPETYQLQGGLGEFLGEFDRLHYSIVLRGDKGAGKSRLLYQFIDAFAAEKLKIAFLSLEMNPDSLVSCRYREEYIKPENYEMIDVTNQALDYDGR